VQLNEIVANVADQDKGRELKLVDPFTGEPTGIKLTVAGPDSDTARRARLKLADELAESADDAGHVSGENREKARLNCLAALVLRWDVREGGKPVPFTTGNVLRLLRVQWVELQVDSFAANRRNFASVGA
jgi:hypothetical protein